TVSDLCLRLAVPIRTLDDAFRSCLGVTPRRFILGMRLNKVRRLLKRPSDDTTVTAAATHHGFFHFGHFAGHYYRLFGELPSDTLRPPTSCRRTPPSRPVPCLGDAPCSHRLSPAAARNRHLQR